MAAVMNEVSGSGDEHSASVLVVDDDVALARALQRVLQHMGLVVEVAYDGDTALGRIEARAFDVMVLDLRMGGLDGLSVLRAARHSPNAPATILHSAFLDIPTTVTAMREGVSDVLEKPAAAQLLADRIRELASRGRSAARLLGAGPGGESPALDNLIGASTAVRLLRSHVAKIAPFREVSVLIEGPTGTGKELVAQAIHDLGARGHPFVTLNCAAVPEHLFESELFGHEAGAFTSARGSPTGLLEEAGEGTVFLDEVGEMPPALQPKLLRVLETREFRKVGSNRVRPFHARVVSATNRPLTEQLDVAFRSDLYFRLAGYTITTPPLSDRPADIPLLVDRFTKQFAERYHGSAMTLEPGAYGALEEYTWPGNVRELRAVVENAAILSRDGVIRRDDVEVALRSRRGDSIALGLTNAEGAPGPADSKSPSRVVGPNVLEPHASLPDLERTLMLRAYADAEENLTRAARSLGIPRSTLRDRLRKFGVL